MLVEKNGKQIEVTEKAYTHVYGPKGFKPVQHYVDAPNVPLKEAVKTEGDTSITPESQEAGNAVLARLTEDELTAVMKNKGTVTAKLQSLGVEFEESTKSDDLKALLEIELEARDLLPE